MSEVFGLPQSQILPRLKTDSRYLSTSSGFVPISPQVTRNSGFSAISATPSAVKVLPVPGPPCNRMVKPFPLPRMRSVDFSTASWLVIRACTSSLVFSSTTRLSNACLLQTTLEIRSTKRSPVMHSQRGLQNDGRGYVCLRHFLVRRL